MQIKKILIPIDFSENSINALEWACSISSKTNAQLHVFHSYEYSATYAQVNYLAFMESIAKTVEKNLLKDMKALENTISSLSSLKPKYHVTFEYAIKGIKDYAEEHNIDLIVMGTRGINDVTNQLMGSITSSVIDHTTIPVLAIPEKLSPKHFGTIVFAVDYKHLIPENALNLVGTLAKTYNSTLKILHVSQSKEEGSVVETDEVLAIAKELKDIPHFYAFTVNKNPYEGIMEFLDKNEADLLVMIPHKHSFFFNIFRSSVTEQVVHHVKIPMLAIQAFDKSK